MNYFLQTAADISPDDVIWTTGYLVVDLASLTQSLSVHLIEEMKGADATNGKGRSIFPAKTNSVGMLLEIWNGSLGLGIDYYITIGRTLLNLLIPMAYTCLI